MDAFRELRIDCIAENAEYTVQEEGRRHGHAKTSRGRCMKAIIVKCFELHEHSVSISTVERLIRGVASVGKRQGHKMALPLREEKRLAMVQQMRQHGMRIHVHMWTHT